MGILLLHRESIDLMVSKVGERVSSMHVVGLWHDRVILNHTLRPVDWARMLRCGRRVTTFRLGSVSVIQFR